MVHGHWIVLFRSFIIMIGSELLQKLHFSKKIVVPQVYNQLYVRGSGHCHTLNRVNAV